MNDPIRKILLALLILLPLAACNLPAGTVNQGTSVAQQAATIVAATLNAVAVHPTDVPITPFASPVVLAATPTVKPTLFINTDQANCRSGPGADFKVIATFAAGTTVDMIGKDSADSYWIVKDPTSLGLCWIPVQDATPGGNFESLPEMTPQVSTKGVPLPPTIFYPNFSCDNSTLTTALTWNDVNNNENGYRIYRDTIQVGDVPANSTTFSETIDFTFGSTVTYSIAAYNDAGTSPQKSLKVKCPP